MTFPERLLERSPILLDGATGSELESRGLPAILPLWSTIALLSSEGRKILRAIHKEYILAGAEIITANTFRTNHRTLKKEGMESQTKSLTQTAVDEVRFACDGTGLVEPVFIAGSVAPVEDCYSPKLVPPRQELRDEHRRHIDNLFDAGVDLILIETMNTIGEAIIACDYAKTTGLSVIVSFVCIDGERLLGGEKLTDAIMGASPLMPDVLMVNCSAPAIIKENLKILSTSSGIPTGAYANVLSRKHTEHDARSEKISVKTYAELVHEWVDLYKLKIVGGCCGTTPEYIHAIREIL